MDHVFILCMYMYFYYILFSVGLFVCEAYLSEKIQDKNENLEVHPKRSNREARVPFTFAPKDNEKDLLLPAINGMLNLLKAVKDNAPRVKRVVATSSFAAVLTVTEGMRPGYT